MFSFLCPQCEGICRPCEFGSASAPTAEEQLLQRRHPKLQTQRAIAIVRIKPIVARLQDYACSNQHGFMSRAADLKEDPVLALELNLFVVEPSRQVHRAIDLEHQFVIGQLMRFGSLRGRPSDSCGRRCVDSACRLRVGATERWSQDAMAICGFAVQALRSRSADLGLAHQFQNFGISYS